MKAKQDEGEDGDESIFEVQALLDPTRESTIPDMGSSMRETGIRETLLTSTQDRAAMEEEKTRLKKLQEQLLIQMGSPIYKQLSNDLKMRQRTMFDKFEVSDKIIKDDSL